ncbi:MAG: hypothetical protein JWM93_1146 [Frankiales bacterium]|nr:hypothetical protein [Frankiales bacterium]
MDPVELHAVAGGRVTQLVRAARPDQWTGPTPCTEWDVRTLLNHLVYEQLWAPELLRGATVEQVGDRFDGDVLGDDPQGAWEKTYGAAHDAVAEADLDGMVHVSWGQISAREYIGQLNLDLAVHGWDFARGTGADDTIDPRVVGALLPGVVAGSDGLTASGAFGTPVAVSDSVDPQTRMLALLGRRR